MKANFGSIIITVDPWSDTDTDILIFCYFRIALPSHLK